VKFWFQAFAYKCNLCRYSECIKREKIVTYNTWCPPGLVGLYKLNAVDPQLESSWFQPVSM
jgi:hypothetical protein